ncbi:MAG: FeoA family protein [Rhodospirillaceae bacterium]
MTQNPAQNPTLTLDHLQIGRPGRIAKIGAPCGTESDPHLEDLLLSLGFEEGAMIEMRHQGAFGGPLAVCVDGRMLAIRPADASYILVEPAVSPASKEAL